MPFLYFIPYFSVACVQGTLGNGGPCDDVRNNYVSCQKNHNAVECEIFVDALQDCVGKAISQNQWAFTIMKPNSYNKLTRDLLLSCIILQPDWHYLICNDGWYWEGVSFAQHQHPFGVRQVPTNIAPEDKIGQDAFDFIQIDGHSQPLQSLGNLS